MTEYPDLENMGTPIHMSRSLRGHIKFNPVFQLKSEDCTHFPQDHQVHPQQGFLQSIKKQIS